ncbi:MAG: ornithine carbamoyltransferase [Firmicutes bacterium]|nr:ornithine carbamoyltransferase [Bacillota bacterium]
MNKLSGRNFIDLDDFTREEILLILQTTRDLKLEVKRGHFHPYLQHKALGCIFDQPSTRTRISFELGMQQLGGYVTYLKPGEIHLGKKESIYDTAKVLSRYFDAIMIRWNDYNEMKQLADAADVPVINGMTEKNHPCQALADIYTMMEYYDDIIGKKVVFFGDRTQPAHSLGVICSKLGLNFVHCCPKKYAILSDYSEIFERNNRISGGTYRHTADIVEACTGAHMVYTDVWWWIGQEEEEAERRKLFAPYQVTAELLTRCDKNVIFEHCLPAMRGVEVTDAVMDGPHAVIYDQAENRMHTEKALMVLLMS